MATSTSNKLYSFLKGYEPAQFTGSPKSQVIESYYQLTKDEFAILEIPIRDDEKLNQTIKHLKRLIDRFLTRYYNRMKEFQSNPDKIERLAKDAKSDSNLLSDLMSILLAGSSEPISNVCICPCNSQAVREPINICDGKCPYYLNHKFCLLYDYWDSDDIDYQYIKFTFPEYKFLALGMIKLASYLMKTAGVDYKDLIIYHNLFEHILTVSKIYELMNPSGKTRQRYLDEAKAMLTQEPVDQNTAQYIYWDGVLTQVFDDIKEGKKKYIRDIARAIKRNRKFTTSKFEDADYFKSMRGTAQSPFTGIHESLLSSAKEVDLFKDDFKEFDEFVGYESQYRTLDDLTDEEKQQTIMGIRTILINNPGKYKPRIIHIGDNPIQDRCNYIHRRMKRILDDMGCDCMSDQDKGRDFVKHLTRQWFLANADKKFGIYCYDFSNATDTLDQRFQYRVLEFIFGAEVANFWLKVSSLPKYIINVEGEYTRYDQRCGQPQGLLGSFDNFSLAHHFVFLMEMKALGFEDYYSTDYYAIVGDDSGSNSIEPEINYLDISNPDRDEMGIIRSTIEMMHFEICSKFAGFRINYDKSNSAHYFSSEAKLDFAKVTFRNGELFSPIPFRLAMNYGNDITSKLAVATWRLERGEPLYKEIFDHLYTKLPPGYRELIESGEIPFFKKLENPNLDLSGSYRARIRYALGLTYLNTSLASCILDDKKRTKLSEDILTEAMKLLLTKQFRLENFDNISPRHKLWSVVEENFDVIDLIKQLYAIDDPDDQYLNLACSALGESLQDAGFFDCLYQMVRTNRELKAIKRCLDSEDIDCSTIFPDFDMRYQDSLVNLSSKFMTRGTTKRPRDQALMLKEVYNLLAELNVLLGIIPGTGFSAN